MLIVAESVSALNKKVVATKKNKIRFTPNSYLYNRITATKIDTVLHKLSSLLKFLLSIKNHLEFKPF
ncbi:hypothetical protein [Helicobacter pylori]|uniref:hypothetical protein n=1 Tax=Helicobacter pylori TaxID=210 RepID=UPI002DD7EFEF|nr:hypothetical protein [Helicobacter pylori]